VTAKTTVSSLVQPCSSEGADITGELIPPFQFGSDLACLLVSLIFDPEDGSNTFMRNVGLSQNFVAKSVLCIFVSHL
jgi:hypothetical protein